MYVCICMCFGIVVVAAAVVMIIVMFIVVTTVVLVVVIYFLNMHVISILIFSMRFPVLCLGSPRPTA